MKYCKHCGAEILDAAVICTKCGCNVEEQPVQNKGDGTALGIIALVGGIIVPLVGWICGGIGLSRANKANNQAGRVLNILGIIAGTASFIYNLSQMQNLFNM